MNASVYESKLGGWHAIENRLADTIDRYEKDGVAVVRGLIDMETIERLCNAIAAQMQNPRPRCSRSSGGPSRPTPYSAISLSSGICSRFERSTSRYRLIDSALS